MFGIYAWTILLGLMAGCGLIDYDPIAAPEDSSPDAAASDASAIATEAADSVQSTPASPECGNGTIEGDEACDDGGLSASCTADCELAPCDLDCECDVFEGHRYMSCLPTREWLAASSHCASLGMTLVRVDSLAENDYLVEAFVGETLAGNAFFIGANDRNIEGEWRWPDDTLFWLGDEAGTSQGGFFQNWDPGTQPSNTVGGEHCGSIFRPTRRWNDVRCDLSWSYVCESP